MRRLLIALLLLCLFNTSAFSRIITNETGIGWYDPLWSISAGSGGEGLDPQGGPGFLSGMWITLSPEFLVGAKYFYAYYDFDWQDSAPTELQRFSNLEGWGIGPSVRYSAVSWEIPGIRWFVESGFVYHYLTWSERIWLDEPGGPGDYTPSYKTEQLLTQGMLSAGAGIASGEWIGSHLTLTAFYDWTVSNRDDRGDYFHVELAVGF